MAKIVGLPKLSPTMEEGTLLKWLIKEGTALKVDDLIAEVETDKAIMEWRALEKSSLLKFLVAEGTALKPDQPVAIFGAPGEDISGLVAPSAVDSKGDSKVSAAVVPLERLNSPHSQSPNQPVATAPVATAPVATVSVVPVSSSADGTRLRASPYVRKVARERGVDLSNVSGSGPQGRVIARDLLSVGSAATSAQTVAGPLTTRLPLSAMRKTIARRLTESKQTVPHFYLRIDIDAGPLNAARASLKTLFPDVPISINDLVLKGTAAALRLHPMVNVSFDGDALVQHHGVHLSVAVAIPDGLLTPVVRDADRKSLREIAAEVRDLAARAKERKLRPDEMSGGTFSVSNLGMFGIHEFAAVINPPEAAILAVGKIRKKAVIKDDIVGLGERMALTLSCDHRAVDGAVGGAFLATLQKILEQPIAMIA